MLFLSVVRRNLSADIEPVGPLAQSGRFAFSRTLQTWSADTKRNVLPVTLGRPLVSPGFAGCQGVGRSGTPHGWPAAGLASALDYQRNHFAEPTK
jgi:hypothetical protein